MRFDPIRRSRRAHACASHRRGGCRQLFGAVLGLVLAASAAAESSPAEVSGFYEDAQKRYHEGDYDGAVIQLKNVLQAEPANLPALVLLGESYIAAGDGPAAESSLQEATRAGADPALTAAPRARAMLLQFKHRQVLAEAVPPSLSHAKRAELLEIKADAALQLNDRKALAATLKEIEELRVNSVGELSIRATLAMRDGRLQDAHRYVDRAVATAPDHPLVRLAHASLRHLEDDQTGALAEYGEVIAREPANVHARLARIGLLFDLKRYADTDADFEFFQSRDSKDPRFLFLQAIRAQAEGDPRRARDTLGEVAKLLEIMGRRIVSGNLQLLMIAGIANYHLGNLELAESYLEEYVKVPSGETETRRMLAAIRIGKQDYAGAIKLLKPILEEHGETADLLALLARAYSGEGQHQRAAEALERATVLRPGDPALATSLAMSKAMKGQSEAALAALSRVFDTEETGETAGMPLAILQLNRQDYAGAERVAATLTSREPDNLTYLNLHGIALAALGRNDEARVRFEKALAVNAGYQPAALNLAKLDRRTENFAAAGKRLSALQKLAPKDAQVMAELARLKRAEGDAKEALKWARAAYKEAPHSFEIARGLIALLIEAPDIEGARNVVFEQENRYPDNLYVLQAHADLLVAAQKPDELRPLLKRMAETAEFNLDWLLPLSEQQIRHGFLADARYTLYKAVQERPQDVPLRARLADVELALGKPEAAAEIADKLIVEFPDHPAGYALRGDIAQQRRAFAEAATHYRDARQREGGERPEIALKQHGVLRESGAHAAAEQVLTEWLALHPEDTWAQAALAEHAMAQQQYGVARARFEVYLERDPGNPEAVNNLAYVLLQLEEFDAARTRAEAAVAMAPDNPLFNDTLGWTLVKLGQAEAALRYLREARTRAASVPDIRYHLAVALHALGRGAEARGELDSALADDVPFAERDEALKLRAALGG